MIPFILAALCNSVGLIHPKDNAIENDTRISDKFASGVGCDVMFGLCLSIVARALSLRDDSSQNGAVDLACV